MKTKNIDIGEYRGAKKPTQILSNNFLSVRRGFSLGILLLLLAAFTQKGMSFSVLYTFTGQDDGGNSAGLTLSSNGYFYGTTVNGGTNDWGAIYRMSSTGTITPLYSFINTPSHDGANPYAGLFLGTNGNFFGTAQIGGTNNSGTIFQVTPNGGLSSLYSFARIRSNKALLPTNSDGETPSYALVEGTNGNLYGTTEEAGTNAYGTFFEMTYKGSVTVLYSFTNNLN